MKRIAFLSFDWDYEIISEYYLGLQDHLKDLDDVQVVIFNAFGYYYARHKPKASSFEIFSLCNIEEYDGFLIQGNRGWPPALRQEIVNKAVALGKPVVSINYDLVGAHSVGTNNYQEEFELVHRVLSDRGCERPAFVNGLKTSVEATARVQGYQYACAQHGIANAAVYQANWQMESGMAAAKKMLRRPNDMPDVVFCCNDDLALGVQKTLQEAGLRVPEDVMITGFDNRKVRLQAIPHITTIDRDYRTITKTALDVIVELIDGAKLPEKLYSPARHILTESCGYLSKEAAAAGDVAAAVGVNSHQRFYEVLSDFQCAVMDAMELYTVFENCERFARELDCPNAYVALNDDFLCSRMPGERILYGDESHLVARAGNGITLACDNDHVYLSYETREILPSAAPFDCPVYTISPLRHNDACVGMVVTEGVPSIMSRGFLAFFLNMLSQAIDAVHNIELLRA